MAGVKTIADIDGVPTSIYMFCDHGFGWEFSRRAIRLAARGGFDLTLVHSAKRPAREKTSRVARLRQTILYGRRTAMLRATAFRAGVRIIDVEDINSEEFTRLLHEPSHGIVAGCGQIFSQRTIDCFATLVNFHPSLLPYYRGPDPSYWVLKNGERASGYTLHGITTTVDSGPILFQRIVPCREIQSPRELNRLIARDALPTLERYIDHLVTGAVWPDVTVDARCVYKVHLGYGRSVRTTQ